MAKKIKRPPRSGHKVKRVSNPDKENISPETETIEDNVVRTERKGCPHFEKGIDLAKVTSKMSCAENIRCEDCRENVSEKRANKGKEKTKGGSKSEPKAIWVCLQCGHFSCGGIGFPTIPQSHAFRHANQTRHHLAVQYENLHLRWCFPCSELIPVEEVGENDEISDTLCNIVKVVKDESPKKFLVVEDVWFWNDAILTEEKIENPGYLVRGMVNLGNTCFFNSIMQNLLALDGVRDQYFELNESSGPLTVSFKNIIFETISEFNLKYLLNPRSLFDCVCAKAPQFRGYQQHDSHELLRFLLDGLCTEELSFKKQLSSENQGPAFVDAVFGGQLLSTVSCLDCGHSSKVFEPFLDLSLPVPMKKIQPKKVKEQISIAKTQKLPPQRKRGYLPVVNGAVSHRVENNVPIEREAGEDENDFSGQSMGPKTKKASSSHQIVVGKNEGKPFLENTTYDLTWLDILEPEVVSYDNGVIWNYSTIMINEENEKQLLPENVTNDLTLLDNLESHIVSYDNGTASNCDDIAASHDARERDHCSEGVKSSSQVLNCTTTTTSSSENFSWLDFVDPYEYQVVNCHEMDSEFDDCLLNLDTRDEINHSNAHSICAETKCSPGYSFENEKPLQVEIEEEVHKEESCFKGEKLTGENKNKNGHDIVPEIDDCLVDIGGEINQSVPQVDSNSAEVNCSSEYSYENEQPLQGQNSEVILFPYKEDTCSNSDKVAGHSFENEKPVQIQSSAEAMLLPYKEESCSNGEILMGEGEFFSSAIGCEQDSSDFSGFGNLFNEPTFVEGSSVKPITGEVDVDEVDNSKFQVSVESCLAYFTKSELLSTSEHGWICEYCSKALQEQKRHATEKHNKAADKIESNGVEDRVNDSSGDIMKGTDSLIVLDDNDAISKKIDSLVKFSSFQENNVGLSQFPSEESVSGISNDVYSTNEVHILGKGFELEANGVEEINSESLKVKRDAIKRILIKKVPSILTIHLKRFSQDFRGRLSKLNGHVDFKETIDMTPYMYSRCNDTEEYKYRLSGVVEHSGTMRGGHYVAYIRGSKNSQTGDNSVWYYASDASVHQVSLQEILQCEAYILFYEKI